MQIWACRMHMAELKHLGALSSALVMDYDTLGMIVCTPYVCSMAGHSGQQPSVSSLP